MGMGVREKCTRGRKKTTNVPDDLTGLLAGPLPGVLRMC